MILETDIEPIAELVIRNLLDLFLLYPYIEFVSWNANTEKYNKEKIEISCFEFREYNL